MDAANLYDAALNEAERGNGQPLYVVEGSLSPSDLTITNQEGDIVSPVLSLTESLLGDPSTVKPATWIMLAVLGLLAANFFIGPGVGKK